MLRSVLSRLVTETLVPHRVANHRRSAETLQVACLSVRRFTDVKVEVPQQFDVSLLDVLVCPLSKKPLRFDKKTNELINEELGIAYPIIDGIPNMIPQEARLLQNDTDPSSAPVEG